MPNGYTVVPNVIPGNLSVAGDLNLLGQLRLGPGPVYGRVFSQTGGVLHCTVNNDKNGIFDQAGAMAQGLVLNVAGPVNGYRLFNQAGQLQLAAFLEAMATDYTLHTNTGNTTDNTIYSKLIHGNVIGVNGGLRIVVAVNTTVQGGVASTLNFKLGGTLLQAISLSTVALRVVQLDILNRNALNNQSLVQIVTSGGVAPLMVFGGSAVDTSVDQTLAVSVQNGAASDSHQLIEFHTQLLNSYGPV